MKEHTQGTAKLICVVACAFIFLLFFHAIQSSLANQQKTDSVENSDKSNNLNDVAVENSEQLAEAAKIAPNLDLKEVAPLPEPVVASPEEEKKSQPKITPTQKDTTTTVEPDSQDSTEITAEQESPTRKKLVLLGAEVPANTSTRLAWSPQVTISGLALPTPVLVINGADPGPTLCLTSAIHGDELNGIEVVRRVMYDIKPEKLSGTLIGVPIVNLQGFQQGSRYLSDRRDLNRYFPGEPNGSLASRIAHSLFTEIITYCDYLIDFHTGSLQRTNLPHIRADMSNLKVAEFVKGFDKIAVMHHNGNPGMLRSAANEAGIVTVTMELGESLRIQENQIVAGTHSVNSLLNKLEMYTRILIWGDPKPAYYESIWLRVDDGGILFSKMGLGDNVSVGDILGVVTDPITNQSSELVSPVGGNILGMAIDQVVIPGFAAYHIGIESTQEAMSTTNEIEPIDIDGEVIGPE